MYYNILTLIPFSSLIIYICVYLEILTWILHEYSLHKAFQDHLSILS